jgi:hypothetical protein
LPTVKLYEPVLWSIAWYLACRRNSRRHSDKWCRSQTLGDRRTASDNLASPEIINSSWGSFFIIPQVKPSHVKVIPSLQWWVSHGREYGIDKSGKWQVGVEHMGGGGGAC